jgi:ABC-2 type transport system ATP-binding protein
MTLSIEPAPVRPSSVASATGADAPPVPAAAEFVAVSKTYRHPVLPIRTVTALRDVSLTVCSGETLGLLGPNRAGKTTLLKILLTLCQPSGGQVVRLGKPASDRSTLARVGYVHENHSFPRYLTAAALLEYYGALSLLKQEVLRPRVERLLERVGLADRSREPIARFSKGMLQRLGVAQALLNEPDLLVLDEPTEGLDLDGRHLLRDVICEVKSRGGSVLLVSHVLPEVEQLCDRVAVLVKGRLVHSGPTVDLLWDPITEMKRPLEKALEEVYARGAAA